MHRASARRVHAPASTAAFALDGAGRPGGRALGRTRIDPASRGDVSRRGRARTRRPKRIPRRRPRVTVASPVTAPEGRPWSVPPRPRGAKLRGGTGPVIPAGRHTRGARTVPRPTQARSAPPRPYRALGRSRRRPSRIASRRHHGAYSPRSGPPPRRGRGPRRAGRGIVGISGGAEASRGRAADPAPSRPTARPAVAGHARGGASTNPGTRPSSPAASLRVPGMVCRSSRRTRATPSPPGMSQGVAKGVCERDDAPRARARAGADRPGTP